ncbi:toll/interleukin-1 receptor domain-containing protein [Lentzea sp. NPDC006480]|uniref:toll/interleukin-1 receptor domain-containing protein n=1 Tax=Lentzea sp. NPDC006480 TaxID=3157176 RepID=UPI0033A7EF97
MQIFVSYSRRDFHAAEALTSVLASRGVQVWFDVEQLRPRTDWETAINAAIDQADAVVVVASPAAMASKWVTGEWQRALSQGKPVHAALVRDTGLPPELTSRYDLRGRFFAEAQRLADGAVPRAKRRLPFSPQMGLLWLSLVFCSSVLVLGALHGWAISQKYVPVHAGMARLAFALALTNALSAGGLVYLAVRLARRTVSPGSLREGFSATLFALVFSLIETLVAPVPRWPFLAAGVVAFAGVVLLSRSRTVHLEMPTGAGDDRIRGRLKGVRLSRGRRFGRLWNTYHPKFVALAELTPGIGAAASYWVWCHEDDLPIAQLVKRMCDAAGFAQEETDPGLAFVVVSTRTPYQVLRSAREVFGDRVVFVLATSLRLEEDDADLRRHQWLDFREQEPEGLYELLRVVVTSRPAERGVVTVPMNVDRFRAPCTSPTTCCSCGCCSA